MNFLYLTKKNSKFTRYINLQYIRIHLNFSNDYLSISENPSCSVNNGYFLLQQSELESHYFMLRGD